MSKILPNVLLRNNYVSIFEILKNEKKTSNFILKQIRKKIVFTVLDMLKLN